MRISKAPIQLSVILLLAAALTSFVTLPNPGSKQPVVAVGHRERLEKIAKSLRVGMTEEEEGAVLSGIPFCGWARDGGQQTGTAAFQRPGVEPGPVLCLQYTPSRTGFRLRESRIED